MNTERDFNHSNLAPELADVMKELNSDDLIITRSEYDEGSEETKMKLQRRHELEKRKESLMDEMATILADGIIDGYRNTIGTTSHYIFAMDPELHESTKIFILERANMLLAEALLKERGEIDTAPLANKIWSNSRSAIHQLLKRVSG